VAQVRLSPSAPRPTVVHSCHTAWARSSASLLLLFVPHGHPIRRLLLLPHAAHLGPTHHSCQAPPYRTPLPFSWHVQAAPHHPLILSLGPSQRRQHRVDLPLPRSLSSGEKHPNTSPTPTCYLLSTPVAGDRRSPPKITSCSSFDFSSCLTSPCPI
jgi:hypothetical protein